MSPIWREAGAEYGIDLEYISRRTTCCGCHPDCHDPTVGCMSCLCRCQEGTVQHTCQPVYLVELPLLLGIQASILEQLMQRHRLPIAGGGEERHLSAKHFRKLLHLIIVRYGLEQVPLYQARAAHTRKRRRRARAAMQTGGDAGREIG